MGRKSGGSIRRRVRTRAPFIVTAGALLLAGCQTAGSSAPTYTGSVGSSVRVSASNMTEAQALAAVQLWGGSYSRNEKDKLSAINYATALRSAGQTAQAVAVLRKAAIYHASDREVLAEFGKALAADGQFEEGLSTIRRAQRRDNPDWQLLSAEGGILDSLGKNDEARALYQQALVMAPGEPQVLNNLGMSYVLTNELDNAEAALRQAAASPKATLKVRQNLDLVLRLKSGAGPRAAAATSRNTAPPKADIAHLEPAPAETDTWKELQKEG